MACHTHIMKNRLYVIVVLAMFQWTCADKAEIEPNTPKFKVSFAVSGVNYSGDKVSSITKAQSATGAKVFDWVEYLYLFIYNSEGNLVRYFHRWSGLGQLMLASELEEGDYTAVAVGHTNSSVWDVDKLSTANISNHYPGPVFVDKIAFKVGASETDVVNLLLKRKVGMLEIDITDEPTHDTYYVRVTMSSMASNYSFHASMPLRNDGSFLWQFYPQPNTASYIDLSAYFFVPQNSTSYKTSVLMEVYSVSGVMLKSQKIDNISIGMNMKTTIRGKLYDTLEQNFTVELEDNWIGEEIIEF